MTIYKYFTWLNLQDSSRAFVLPEYSTFSLFRKEKYSKSATIFSNMNFLICYTLTKMFQTH